MTLERVQFWPGLRVERNSSSLEALRGIAALLVVFYHLQNIFGARAGVVPLGGLFGSGDRGVDVFFVLSGFIIARTHGKDIGKAERLPLYLYKRACRVYPSVWILTACAAAVYFCDFGGAAKAWKLDSWNVVASTLLLPQSKPPLVNVTWTLTYEIFFYLLFSSLVVSRRMGILLLLAWQAGTAVAAAHVIRFTGPLTAYYLRPVCLEFGIGMLCAILAAQPRVARGMSRPAMVFVAVAGIAAVILALLYEALWYPHGLEPVRPFVFGLGAGAAILGLTLLEQRKMLRVPAVLVRLGAASVRNLPSTFFSHYPGCDDSCKDSRLTRQQFLDADMCRFRDSRRGSFSPLRRPASAGSSAECRRRSVQAPDSRAQRHERYAFG